MMTIEEKIKLYDKIDELESLGMHHEAKDLKKTIPLKASVAMAAKEVFGADAVKTMVLNLSEAEEVYGKDWLNR